MSLLTNVRIGYLIAIISTILTLLILDYVMISLWLTGYANLSYLLVIPITSIIILTYLLTIKSIYDNFVKKSLSLGVKEKVFSFSLLLSLSLVYLCMMYFIVNKYLSLELYIVNEDLIHDYYFGLGLAFYNCGLLLSLIHVVHDLVQGNYVILRLLTIINTLVRKNEKSKNNETILIS